MKIEVSDEFSGLNYNFVCGLILKKVAGPIIISISDIIAMSTANTPIENSIVLSLDDSFF